MKLSIIIPVYNVEKYLEETVKSLGIGHEDEMEIILVDDCSKDKSGVLCDKLASKDSRIKVIHKLVNEGLSMARNTGIANASGEYVVFLDSDDKYENEDSIDKILQEVNTTNYDMYFINMTKWWDNDNSYKEVNSFDNEILKGQSLNELLPYISNLKSFPASASLKVIKKDILVNNDLFFTNGIYCEDIDWFLRVLTSNTVLSCGYIDINYIYRQNNCGSITANIKDKNLDDLVSIIERVQVAAEDIGENKVYLYRILAFELMVSILQLDKINSKKLFAPRIKKLLYLMKYSSDKRVKLTYICSKFLGVVFTSKLLNLVR